MIELVAISRNKEVPSQELEDFSLPKRNRLLIVASAMELCVITFVFWH